MADLLRVWEHAKTRRDRAATSLTAEAEGLLGRLSPPWPTEVVVLASEVPSELLLQEVAQRLVEVALSLS